MVDEKKIWSYHPRDPRERDESEFAARHYVKVSEIEKVVLEVLRRVADRSIDLFGKVYDEDAKPSHYMTEAVRELLRECDLAQKKPNTVPAELVRELVALVVRSREKHECIHCTVWPCGAPGCSNPTCMKYTEVLAKVKEHLDAP